MRLASRSWARKHQLTAGTASLPRFRALNAKFTHQRLDGVIGVKSAEHVPTRRDRKALLAGQTHGFDGYSPMFTFTEGSS